MEPERRSEFRPPVALDDILPRAAQVAADVARPHSEQVDRDARWPVETMEALRAAGLGGLVVPVEDGGLGQGLGALAAVCETIGRECSSSAICFGMHCVGSAVIASKATDDQQRRYLAPIARGEHLTTLALSEPGTGAHFYLPQATYERDEADGYIVRGGKTFVTNGGHADSYVVSVTGGGAESAPGHFSCLILDAETEGLHWGGPWSGLGMRGNDSKAVRLDAVRVPAANLLGHEGDELWYVFNVIAPFFLMAMAGTYLGVARAALDEARTHMVGRVYSSTGSSLAHNPVLQHRLGTLWATLERTRTFVFDAAARADAGDPDALAHVLSAKAEVADTAVTIANEAMTLVGGIGYGENGRLARCLRDARAAHVMAPTTDILRTWAGRVLLGQPLLSD